MWEVRAFTGRDAQGRPTQVSRTIRGAKRDANRVAAELTVRRSSGAAKVTMAELLDLWTEQDEAAWAVSTTQNQKSRVAMVKTDPIAKIRLVRLTAVDVDRWHARLARAGVGEGSIRNQHQTLRAAVTQAVRWGWVTTNVVAVAQLGPRAGPPRGHGGRRGASDIAGCQRAGRRNRGGAGRGGGAQAGGCDRGPSFELAALRWDDLEGDRLAIDSSMAIIRHGKPGSPQSPTLRDDPTKTANRRTVTLDQTTVGQLEDLKHLQGSYGPWLLSVGERPVNPERIAAWWRRARDRAAVDKKWRLHDLRHWSATTSIARGHDIRTVANRLGHANPAMTLRVYAHAVESADGAVADMLGEVLDNGGDDT